MAYNGWKNRATWNVNLWAFNDQATYATMRLCQPYTAESARQFCEGMWPSGQTPDGCNLSEVAWDDIAEAFNEA